MNRPHPKKDLYRAEEASGLSRREIAEKYGVSVQMVHQACGKYGPGHFRKITEKGCVYPNLRNWMNENKVSYMELLRRMGLLPVSRNLSTIYNWLRGMCDPRKETIDKMIAITGIPYEKLFTKESNDV